MSNTYIRGRNNIHHNNTDASVPEDEDLGTSTSSIDNTSVSNENSIKENDAAQNKDRLSGNRQTSAKRSRSRTHSIPKCDRVEPQKRINSCLTYLVLIIFIALIAIALNKFNKKNNNNGEKCAYSELREKFQGQDIKMWESISSAVENILNKRSTSPAVNLFIHPNGSRLEKFVKQIADETLKCFGGKSQLVEMDEKDFTSQDVVEDYGNAINIFKRKIENGRVAVIVNLNKIPAEAARALHTICDTFSPIAKEIVIFLTLVTPTSNGKPVANAQNTLRELWSSTLPDNELEPLITRVTDQVLPLK